MSPPREPAPAAPGRLPWLVAILLSCLALARYLPRVTYLAATSAAGLLGDTPPSIAPSGPTVVQLERLRHLVSRRVHVADVLVGESRWLEGSWLVVGDALIGVDASRAEVVGRDELSRTATIVLPRPAVISARVDHERTRRWDVRSRGWIPLAGALLGDRGAMEGRAMLEAQRLVERAASSDDFATSAREGVEGLLQEFYRGVGWRVAVRWKE
ncbi:DUF4230 domain-containing protein [Aquisphaera giovannonii]|nr:DUF4230 domain-containing protein [Aquisphaera giovannonii]